MVKTDQKKKHLKRKCKGYNNAKKNLQDIRRKLERKRTKFLVKLIKTTLRSILARILGCKFLRKSAIKQQVRKAMKKIRLKKFSMKNVKKLTKFFKSMLNHNTKKRVIKKTKKIMKKILFSYLKRKRLDSKTLIMLNKLIEKNCKIKNICFQRRIFSLKCYLHSKACLRLRSLKKTSKIAKQGNIMTKLIKKFISFR